MNIRVDGDDVWADGFLVAEFKSDAPATVMDTVKRQIETPLHEQPEFDGYLSVAIDDKLDDVLPKLMGELLRRAKSKNTKDMIVSVFEEFGA